MSQDAQLTGFGLVKPESGYNLIDICRQAAKEYPESYTNGDWIPHRWVLKALKMVAIQAYGDGRSDEADTHDYWRP